MASASASLKRRLSAGRWFLTGLSSAAISAGFTDRWGEWTTVGDLAHPHFCVITSKRPDLAQNLLYVECRLAQRDDISVVIVEDHLAVRKGLELLLEDKIGRASCRER